MKKLKIGLILILYFLFQNSIEAQTKYEIEINEGFVFYDLIHSPKDINNFFLGYGVLNNFSIYRVKKINSIINGRLGVGYTGLLNLTEEYFYFDVGGSSGLSTTSYLNVKLGADVLLKNKISLSTVINNYILLHNQKQGLYQHRYFLTIDLGIRIPLSEKWEFNLFSAIPLTSMVSGRVGVLTPGQSGVVNFDLKGEMTGLYLGLNYKF